MNLVPAGFVVLFLLGGCVGSSASTSPGPGAPSASTSLDTGAIDGHVVDDEVAPISGAQVFLRDAQTVVTTGPDGSFAFSGLSPARYLVLASRLGYRDAQTFADIKAGAVTRVQITMDRIPVADPDFNETMKFRGALLVNNACEENNPPTQGYAWQDYPFPINASKADGTELAAITTAVDLKSTPASATIDIDMALWGPTGQRLVTSTSSGPNEHIETTKILAPGTYTVRVCLWAGANVEYFITVVVTYAQGEMAQCYKERRCKLA